MSNQDLPSRYKDPSNEPPEKDVTGADGVADSRTTEGNEYITRKGQGGGSSANFHLNVLTLTFFPHANGENTAIFLLDNAPNQHCNAMAQNMQWATDLGACEVARDCIPASAPRQAHSGPAARPGARSAEGH